MLLVKICVLKMELKFIVRHKKLKNYYRNWVIGYTLIALILAVAGYFQQESYYYYGAIVVVLVSFYWIWKAWNS